MKISPVKKTGKIFFTIFALPFWGVGIWMLISILISLTSWQNMKSWDTVPAYVISGGYESNYNDNSTSYKAYGQYHYTYNGKEYTNDLLSIYKGSDNIGDFQENLGRKLALAAGSKRPIDIFVDPDQPSNSVVERDIRWEMIGFNAVFVITFGGVGLGLILWMIMAPKPKDLTLTIYQEKPWLANEDWQDATIYSNSKMMLYFTWGFAVFWNAISAYLPFLVYEEVTQKQNYPALIGLLFPLVGIGLIIWAVRHTMQWKRFGKSPVKLDPFPGSIDGQVGGTIELKLPHSDKHEFIMTLSSIYSYETGGGKNRSQQENLLWQDKIVAHTEMGIYGTRITFRFDVPENLKESDAVKNSNNYSSNTVSMQTDLPGIGTTDKVGVLKNLKKLGSLNNRNSYYLWRLNMRADLPGIDINRDFEIPVYQTSEESRYISNRAVEYSETATLDMDTQAAKSALNLTQGTYGPKLLYPMGRNLMGAFMGIIIGGIFAGAGVFMILHEGLYVFGGVFASMGALIVLACFYMCTNSLTITKDQSGDIVTTRRILGLPMKKCDVAIDDITRIDKESNYSTSSGGNTIEHFTLYAHNRYGGKIVIGEGFKGQGEADAAIDILKDAFGINLE